jgi:tetrapyrrole methylase family protein/MazG family protein
MPEYIPPSIEEATRDVALPEGELESVGSLIKIMARLRMPDGCPWDQAQTHASLLPNLLEESYEYIHAVNEGDVPAMKEELGDLLLQVIFHAQIAQESGAFNLGMSARELSEKLIRRHPHVFGDDKAADPHGALASWNAAKRKEGEHTVNLDKVPRAMPALLRARKVQEKAAKVGFQWPEVEGALAKVDEELGELRREMVSAKVEPSTIEDELGDLLFAVVNVARYVHVDPEIALIGTVEKFIKRFSYIEKRLEEQGLALGEASLEVMDRYWEEAKEVQ